MFLVGVFHFSAPEYRQSPGNRRRAEKKEQYRNTDTKVACTKYKDGRYYGALRGGGNIDCGFIS